MRVVHIGNLPLMPDHPDCGRLVMHPGRWVLNHAIAQKKYADVIPEIVVQVPGASANHVTEWEGIRVHYLAAPDRLRAVTLFWFDARRIGRYVRGLDPDIVHVHGTEDAYGLAAQWVGRPYVITVQGLYFLINRVLRPKIISRSRAVEFTERRCLLRARHVIAKSDYVAEALRAQFPHLTLHRIPNTIDSRLADIREEKENRVLAFVGMIDHRKGLDLIADALAGLQGDFPDVRLWVFGDNPVMPSDYEASIKTRLAAIVGNRVTFHGILSGLEVARCVARATALLAPSREEMFGNQVVEALAVGTFAIVTEQTAMAENIRRFGNGAVIPQENAPALAGAIRAILESPADFTTGIRSREKILAEFGPAHVAAQHRTLYDRLWERRS